VITTLQPKGGTVQELHDARNCKARTVWGGTFSIQACLLQWQAKLNRGLRLNEHTPGVCIAVSGIVKQRGWQCKQLVQHICIAVSGIVTQHGWQCKQLVQHICIAVSGIVIQHGWQCKQLVQQHNTKSSHEAVCYKFQVQRYTNWTCTKSHTCTVQLTLVMWCTIMHQ